MDDFTPFLQIIHISDLHVIDPGTQNAVAARLLIRRLRYILPMRLVDQIDDGILPHDPLAAVLFRDFVSWISTQDPQWSNHPTWLVDTGDLTSLGDIHSLDLGLQYWNDLARVVTASASIYGNHDAWPGAFPLFANFSALVRQPQVLISRNFTVATPNLALQAPIPHAKATCSSISQIVLDTTGREREGGRRDSPSSTHRSYPVSRSKLLERSIELSYFGSAPSHSLSTAAAKNDHVHE